MRDIYIKPKRKEVIHNPDGSVTISYELSTGELIRIPNIMLIGEADSIKNDEPYFISTSEPLNWFSRKSRISPRDRDECYADIWLYLEEEDLK